MQRFGTDLERAVAETLDRAGIAGRDIGEAMGVGALGVLVSDDPLEVFARAVLSR